MSNSANLHKTVWDYQGKQTVAMRSWSCTAWSCTAGQQSRCSTAHHLSRALFALLDGCPLVWHKLEVIFNRFVKKFQKYFRRTASLFSSCHVT